MEWFVGLLYVPPRGAAPRVIRIVACLVPCSPVVGRCLLWALAWGQWWRELCQLGSKALQRGDGDREAELPKRLKFEQCCGLRTT